MRVERLVLGQHRVDDVQQLAHAVADRDHARLAFGDLALVELLENRVRLDAGQAVHEQDLPHEIVAFPGHDFAPAMLARLVLDRIRPEIADEFVGRFEAPNVADKSRVDAAGVIADAPDRGQFVRSALLVDRRDGLGKIGLGLDGQFELIEEAEERLLDRRSCERRDGFGRGANEGLRFFLAERSRALADAEPGEARRRSLRGLLGGRILAEQRPCGRAGDLFEQLGELREARREKLMHLVGDTQRLPLLRRQAGAEGFEQFDVRIDGRGSGRPLGDGEPGDELRVELVVLVVLEEGFLIVAVEQRVRGGDHDLVRQRLEESSKVASVDAGVVDDAPEERVAMSPGEIVEGFREAVVSLSVLVDDEFLAERALVGVDELDDVAITSDVDADADLNDGTCWIHRRTS